MPDVFTRAKRSQVMSRIRSHGNKDTELALIGIFRRERITGWRRQIELRITSCELQIAKREGRKSRNTGTLRKSKTVVRNFRVRPDFVFPKLKLAVFVDGCFWHGCPLHATKPRNHAAFWQKKLAGNRARDRKVTRTLRAAGWRVLRIWEHELRPPTRWLARIRKTLRQA